MNNVRIKSEESKDDAEDLRTTPVRGAVRANEEVQAKNAESAVPTSTTKDGVTQKINNKNSEVKKALPKKKAKTTNTKAAKGGNVGKGKKLKLEVSCSEIKESPRTSKSPKGDVGDNGHIKSEPLDPNEEPEPKNIPNCEENDVCSTPPSAVDGPSVESSPDSVEIKCKRPVEAEKQTDPVLSRGAKRRRNRNIDIIPASPPRPILIKDEPQDAPPDTEATKENETEEQNATPTTEAGTTERQTTREAGDDSSPPASLEATQPTTPCVRVKAEPVESNNETEENDDPPTPPPPPTLTATQTTASPVAESGTCPPVPLEVTQPTVPSVRVKPEPMDTNNAEEEDDDRPTPPPPPSATATQTTASPVADGGTCPPVPSEATESPIPSVRVKPEPMETNNAEEEDDDRPTPPPPPPPPSVTATQTTVSPVTDGGTSAPVPSEATESPIPSVRVKPEPMDTNDEEDDDRPTPPPPPPSVTATQTTASPVAAGGISPPVPSEATQPTIPLVRVKPEPMDTNDVENENNTQPAAKATTTTDTTSAASVASVTTQPTAAPGRVKTERSAALNDVERSLDNLFNGSPSNAEEAPTPDMTGGSTSTQPANNEHIEPLDGGGEEREEGEEEEEGIPENFFDDLLVDRLNERFEEAVNNDLEMKYSEKLKELRELSQLEQDKRKDKRSRNNKKHKKNKKKSRKRSHSPEEEGGSNRTDALAHKRKRNSFNGSLPDQVELLSTSSNYGNLPKVTTAPISTAPRSRGLQVKAEFRGPPLFEEELQCLPVDPRTRAIETLNSQAQESMLGCQRIKLERPEVQPPEEDSPAISPKVKRERSMFRATNVLLQFQNASEKPDGVPLSQFLYISTVRKLPSSHSYVTQQIYENRSPLHTVNNVCYKFNSNSTRFNMHEWGLEALSPHCARIAKLISFDANSIHEKLKTIKIPSKLQQMKEKMGQCGQDVEQTCSSFFTNAMTQTDEVTVIAGRRQPNSSIGVQTKSICSSIGVQTAGTSSQQSHNDLPLMHLMRELNDNQLMALHDFAELLREPASNALDMYRLRQRMLDIYKCSQLPSALATPTHPMPQVQLHPPPQLQPIRPLQPTYPAIAHNYDPRSTAMAYANRAVPQYDPHQPPAFAHPPMPIPQQQQQQQPPQQPQQPQHQHHQQHQMSDPAYVAAVPMAPRYYGRGGARR